jgi:hypothetical protein
MNEGAGDKIYDLSNDKNTGTLISSVSRVAKGLYFAGDDDYVDVGTTYQFTSEDFTIMCKFRHDDNNPDMLFCNGIWQEYGILMQVGNAGKYLFTTSQLGANQDTKSQDNVYTVGEMATVAFVREKGYDGGKGRIYHNGYEVSSYVTQDVITDPVTPGAITTRFGINVNGLAYDFTGVMEWVLIWNRALNSSEVYQVYQNPYGIISGHRFYVGYDGGVAVSGVNAAGQASIAISSLAGLWRNRPIAGQADIVTSSLAGFRRSRVAAGEADITTSSLAGFRRFNRPGAAAASIATSSTAGLIQSLGGIAAITTSSTAGFRRLNIPGAATANITTGSASGFRRLNIPGAGAAAIITRSYAGATGGTGVAVLEEETPVCFPDVS